MKLPVISLLLAISLSSGAAFAEARDTRTETKESESDRGPGGTRLAFDLDYANGIEPEVRSGYGGQLRFGREYDLLVVSLTPELVGELHAFSQPSDTLQFAGMAGGRATLGKIIEPGVFAHVGAGHLSLPGDPMTGLALDLGVTLDVTIIPEVDVGVHGAWDSMTWEGDGMFDWYRLGAHIAFAP